MKKPETDLPTTQPITLFHCPQTRSTGGTALTWMTGFGLVEAVPPVKSYVERWNALPMVKTVADIEARSIAERDAAA